VSGVTRESLDLLRRIRSGELNNCEGLSEADIQRIEMLSRDELIDSWIDGSVALRAEGEDALRAAEEEDEQHAAEKADRDRKEALEQKRWRKDARRSWVQWTVTTVLTIASFFAGAAVEKLTGFVEWIAAILHW
jgi:hypothetical protein